MPRLLIYEECLAAGREGPLGDDAQQFLAEGLAMAVAIAEDFAKLSDWKVRVIRAAEHQSCTPDDVDWKWVDAHYGADACLQREAKIADASLVIAPECGGLLRQRAQAVLDSGSRLLGPAPEWIELASDKTALLHRLANAGLRTPKGALGPAWQFEDQSWRFPLILKPNDGAGAANTHFIQNREQLRALHSSEDDFGLLMSAKLWRGEEFVPGKAASVAMLSGPAGNQPLRPAKQNILFAEDGQISYQGGAMNLTPAEEARAKSLGHAVMNAMPPTNGYSGIDLILGEATDGSQDIVIEVNPRLTTSYLGLRTATDDSLAKAMWRITQGETMNINWRLDVVEFTKQGQVTIRDR